MVHRIAELQTRLIYRTVLIHLEKRGNRGRGSAGQPMWYPCCWRSDPLPGVRERERDGVQFFERTGTTSPPLERRGAWSNGADPTLHLHPSIAVTSSLLVDLNCKLSHDPSLTSKNLTEQYS